MAAHTKGQGTAAHTKAGRGAPRGGPAGFGGVYSSTTIRGGSTPARPTVYIAAVHYTLVSVAVYVAAVYCAVVIMAVYRCGALCSYQQGVQPFGDFGVILG